MYLKYGVAYMSLRFIRESPLVQYHEEIMAINKLK